MLGIHSKRQPKISLLIPFSTKDPIRKRNFKWLLKYWKHELPDAEIIIGKSKSDIFCKGEALNHAARKSTGRVLVILDADAYLEGSVINRCADKILEELYYGNHLWYVPYTNLYRLNEYITEFIIASPPSCPMRIPSPPPVDWVQDSDAGMAKSKYGARYGAMITILPREAYHHLGGFDERFKGWGGEDVALLMALDTLWGKHKNTTNDVLHLWHPFYGQSIKIRRWKGQTTDNPNSHLTTRYDKATGKPSVMRKLIDEYRDK